MASEWQWMCKGRNFEVEDESVNVRFESGRTHSVQVKATEDGFEFQAIVARARMIEDPAKLQIQIWMCNRTAQLVGFRLDGRGRVVASGWVPKAGASAEEFQRVLHRVAAESDRLEFLLTGRDEL